MASPSCSGVDGRKPLEFLPVSKKVFQQLSLNSITGVMSQVLSLYEKEYFATSTTYLNEQTLKALCDETEQLQKLGVMNVLPMEKLLQMINILVVNIKATTGMTNDTVERIVGKSITKMYGSICLLNILAFLKKPWRAYLEVITELLADVLLVQLHVLILPELKQQQRRVCYYIEAIQSFVNLFCKLLDKLSKTCTLINAEISFPNEIITQLIKLDVMADHKLQNPVFRFISNVYKCETKANRLHIFYTILNEIKLFKTNKTYKLESGEFVRLPTALLMKILHKLSESVDVIKLEITYKKIASEIENSVKNYIHQFLVLYDCPSTAQHYKAFFEQFIDDVLLMCCKAEWPAAGVTIKCCLEHMQELLTTEGVDKHHLIAALDFVSRIAETLLRFRQNSQAIETMSTEMLEGQELPQLKTAVQHYVLAYLYRNGMKSTAIFAAVQYFLTYPKKTMTSQNDFVRFTKHTLGGLIAFSDDYVYSKALNASTYLFLKSSTKILETAFSCVFESLNDNVVQVRAKSLKILANFVSIDSSLLSRDDVIAEINAAISDEMPLVREAALDLLSKGTTSITHVEKYYKVLLNRFKDPGLSVRKKALKILTDFCLAHPSFEKTSEIVSFIMSRLSKGAEAEGVNVELFENLWWPTSPDNVIGKTQNLISILGYTHIKMEDFEETLKKVINSRWDKTTFRSSTELLVSYLVAKCTSEGLCSLEKSTTMTFSILRVFSKIQPCILGSHFEKLQNLIIEVPCSGLCCDSTNSLLELLENILPFSTRTQSSDEQLQDKIKLMIATYPHDIVYAATKFLAKLVNNYTKNYLLIRTLFGGYYKYLVEHEHEFHVIPDKTINAILSRSTYVLGLFLKEFNFKDYEIAGDLTVQIPEKVFSTLLKLLIGGDEGSKCRIIHSIRYVCLRHTNLLLNPNLRAAYKTMLNDKNAGDDLKLAILRSLEIYFNEDGNYEQADWKNANIKTMQDIMSGESSTIAQSYIADILPMCFSPKVSIRYVCFKIIKHIVIQGLAHPMNLLSHIIALSTDDLPISLEAKKLVEEIELRIPGAIMAKCNQGLKLSYDLQFVLQGDNPKGLKLDTLLPINADLYFFTQKRKKERRALILNILRNFDDKKENSYAYLCYLIENIAMFPYSILDEVLFVIYQIDTVVLLSTTSVLQKLLHYFLDEEKSTDVENKLSQFNNTSIKNFQTLLGIGEACLVLNRAKLYLQNCYNIPTTQLQSYTTYNSTNLYEKPIKKKSGLFFKENQRLMPCELVKRFKRFQKFAKQLVADDDDNINFDDQLEEEEDVNLLTKSTEDDAKMDVDVDITTKTPSSKMKTNQSCSRKTPIKKTPRKKRKRVSSFESDSDFEP